MTSPAIPNTSPEGCIEADLTRRIGAEPAVVIRSTRPHLADRLLRGRTPEEAARIVGLMFSLCGRAQKLACEAACAAAAGAPDHAAPTRAVLSEMAREHAWRLLLDWPAGDPAVLAPLIQAAERADFAVVLADALTQSALGEAPAKWLERDYSGVSDWIEARATPLAHAFAALPMTAETHASVFLPALPQLSDGDLAELARQALELPGFSAQPVWQGRPAETGPLARQHRAPLLLAWLAAHGRGGGARMLARLVELAGLPARLQGEGGSGEVLRAVHCAPNVGVAAVETSRGLLLHVARLEASRIAAYRIVAPTEWNFHPDGPIRSALLAAPDTNAARIAAQTLDACVDFHLNVVD